MRSKASPNKKNIFNIIMVVAIIAIVVSGTMMVGSLKGWFDANDTAVLSEGHAEEESGVVQNKIGSANIERGGIAYSLKDGTTLKDGDIIETLNGSLIDVEFGKNRLSLNQNSEVTVKISKDGMSIELIRGEAFADIGEPFQLRVMETDIAADAGVFSVSAPSGSANIYVLENGVTINNQVINAGEAVSLLRDGIHIRELAIEALNDFNIQKISEANESKTLCFTNEQLHQLAADREAAVRAACEAQQLEDEEEQQIDALREANKDKQASTQPVPAAIEGDDSQEERASSNQTPAQTCTIEIRCDTILDNMSELTEGKNKYVPANGCILARSTLEFSDGETVFDVLKRACSVADIQLEYSWTPVYDSYYIEGIHHIYEFDCGNESGWMYKVNGWFPNYGCSSYKLNNGDEIVWSYSCKGLGKDVGGSVS